MPYSSKQKKQEYDRKRYQKQKKEGRDKKDNQNARKQKSRAKNKRKEQELEKQREMNTITKVKNYVLGKGTTEASVDMRSPAPNAEMLRSYQPTPSETAGLQVATGATVNIQPPGFMTPGHLVYPATPDQLYLESVDRSIQKNEETDQGIKELTDATVEAISSLERFRGNRMLLNEERQELEKEKRALLKSHMKRAHEDGSEEDEAPSAKRFKPSRPDLQGTTQRLDFGEQFVSPTNQHNSYAERPPVLIPQQVMQGHGQPGMGHYGDPRAYNPTVYENAAAWNNVAAANHLQGGIPFEQQPNLEVPPAASANQQPPGGLPFVPATGPCLQGQSQGMLSPDLHKGKYGDKAREAHTCLRKILTGVVVPLEREIDQKTLAEVEGPLHGALHTLKNMTVAGTPEERKKLKERMMDLVKRADALKDMLVGPANKSRKAQKSIKALDRLEHCAEHLENTEGMLSPTEFQKKKDVLLDKVDDVKVEGTKIEVGELKEQRRALREYLLRL